MSNKNNVININSKSKQLRELEEAAYTPSTIGRHIVSFFRKNHLTRGEGLDILKSMYDLLDTGESDDPTAHQYVTTFTEHGATAVELVEALTWVLTTMKELDDAIESGLAGVRDDKTIH